MNGSGILWRFTGFYGEPDASRQKRTWDLLRRLGAQSGRDWMCMGDFNEILLHREKEGGRTTPEWRLRHFREALVHNDLCDLRFNGYPYTWSDNHEAPNTIRERLDRAVATPGWKSCFPQAHVHHLSTRASDHVPLLLLLSGRPNSSLKPKRRFHFEAM